MITLFNEQIFVLFNNRSYCAPARRVRDDMFAVLLPDDEYAAWTQAGRHYLSRKGSLAEFQRWKWLPTNEWLVAKNAELRNVIDDILYAHETPVRVEISATESVIDWQLYWQSMRDDLVTLRDTARRNALRGV